MWPDMCVTRLLQLLLCLAELFGARPAWGLSDRLVVCVVSVRRLQAQPDAVSVRSVNQHYSILRPAPHLQALADAVFAAESPFVVSNRHVPGRP